jgi:hypothetical protein
MKNTKLIGFFATGILAFLLAGCFNPITAIPPRQNDPNIDIFTVDVMIGKNREDARSVAGPGPDRIKGDIRNIIQLIVVDNSGNIAAFDEVRREKNSDTEAALRIESLPFGQTYHFLLLMGHRDRDYAAEAGAQDNEYRYTSNPTPFWRRG